MTSSFTTLLFLGMSVGSRTRVQNVSKPNIWAEPGSLIPLGSSVTIWCQGTQSTEVFHLHKKGSSRHQQILIKPEYKANFSIPHVTDRHAGEYFCHYLRKKDEWSWNSDPLNLVVTGSYNKPFLSALLNSVVTFGVNVTLQCHSGQKFDSFILTKEGKLESSRVLKSQLHSNEQYQALFPVDPVTLSNSWTFRCYGYYRKKSSVWSHPSDPLKLPLNISGATLIVHPSLNKSDSRNVSHPQDYMVENIIRIIVAGLLLLVLGIFLLEAHHSHKKSKIQQGHRLRGNRCPHTQRI